MPFQRPLILSIVTSIFKDRAFSAMLSRIWDGWRESLVMVKPATVLAWRRKRGLGQPRISVEVRKLIVEMAEITVSRCMPNRPPPAGSRQRWVTFMHNHLHETLAIDFAVVPTATFGILYVFFVLSLERRRVLHFNVTQHPTAEWTAQQVVTRCGLIGLSSPVRSICLVVF